jgi:HD superfamily phosphohydrolase
MNRINHCYITFFIDDKTFDLFIIIVILASSFLMNFNSPITIMNKCNTNNFSTMEQHFCNNDSNVFQKKRNQNEMNLNILDNNYVVKSRSELLRKAKEINIPVHGYVPLTLMAKYFIDNRYFQRLNKLKQLGTCDFVFPGATHTRFEHSIGTYHLADRLTNKIKTESDNCKIIEYLEKIPELQSHYLIQDDTTSSGLDYWIIELIKIAALCHDIGHGPYSHVFDDVFIKNSILRNHPLATHEQRSYIIIEKIVKESPTLSKFMTDDDIKFIQSLIEPGKNRTGFVYQIVSNNLNGLDVDKFDYINRDALHTGVKSGFDFSRLIDAALVINDTIVYPEQAEYDIYNLFTTRHAMHRRIYSHKGVVSAQYIITEIMKILDKVINITNSILDLDTFVKMTDSYILNYLDFVLDMKNNDHDPFKGKLDEKDYLDLEILRSRLQTHNLYVHVATITTREEFDIKSHFNDDNHMILKTKVGFVSGDKLNPLDNIYVYKTKDFFINRFNAKAYKIKKTDITHIIPDAYQEYVTMVFRRDRDTNGIIADKELFQTIENTINKQKI